MPAFGSRVEKRVARDGRPAVSLSEPHLGAHVHVLQIVRGVTVQQQEVGKRRRRDEVGDGQPLIGPDVHLDLGNRAHAQTDAEPRDREEVAAQAGHRIGHVALVVDAGLDQDATRADGFGIFGLQRTLLRE